MKVTKFLPFQVYVGVKDKSVSLHPQEWENFADIPQYELGLYISNATEQYLFLLSLVKGIQEGKALDKNVVLDYIEEQLTLSKEKVQEEYPTFEFSSGDEESSLYLVQNEKVELIKSKHHKFLNFMCSALNQYPLLLQSIKKYVAENVIPETKVDFFNIEDVTAYLAAYNKEQCEQIIHGYDYTMQGDMSHGYDPYALKPGYPCQLELDTLRDLQKREAFTNLAIQCIDSEYPELTEYSNWIPEYRGAYFKGLAIHCDGRIEPVPEIKIEPEENVHWLSVPNQYKFELKPANQFIRKLTYTENTLEWLHNEPVYEFNIGFKEETQYLTRVSSERAEDHYVVKVEINGQTDTFYLYDENEHDVILIQDGVPRLVNLVKIFPVSFNREEKKRYFDYEFVYLQ